MPLRNKNSTSFPHEQDHKSITIITIKHKEENQPMHLGEREVTESTKATRGCLVFQSHDIKAFSLPIGACHFLATSLQVEASILRLPQKTSATFSLGSLSTSRSYLLYYLHGAHLLPTSEAGAALPAAPQEHFSYPAEKH